MHNRALHAILAAFVEEAAAQLAEEVSAGAEIPFELVEQGRASAPLYCYRPLTDRFLADRLGSLARLPSYPAAARGLETLEGLDAYLEASGHPSRPAGPRARADAALLAFLSHQWQDATDFVFDRVRFGAAFAALEEAVYDGRVLVELVVGVEGLVLASDEVLVGDGLVLVRAERLDDPPGDLRAAGHRTLAVLRLESGPGEPGVETAGRRLRRLQTAMRLWDDAEPSLHPVAWARSGMVGEHVAGGWGVVPLATGVRRTGNGECLVPAEEEDPLRAFCALVARRTPRAGELAWALRRFELGCERPVALEALTDWLAAARALLDDVERPANETVCRRLAAICAEPPDRPALTDRLGHAMALERAAVAGLVRPEPAVEELVAELAGHLRAVLRDVLCGHLDPDLRGVADTLAEDDEPAVA
jgi:hypothetical protein